MEKLNQHANQQALTNSVEEGLKLQTQSLLQRALKQQQKQAAELQTAAVEQQRRVAEQQNKTNTEESDSPSTSKGSYPAWNYMVNLFCATGLCLYPLQTSENRSFSDVFKGYR